MFLFVSLWYLLRSAIKNHIALDFAWLWLYSQANVIQSPGTMYFRRPDHFFVGGPWVPLLSFNFKSPLHNIATWFTRPCKNLDGAKPLQLRTPAPCYIIISFLNMPSSIKAIFISLLLSYSTVSVCACLLITHDRGDS